MTTSTPGEAFGLPRHAAVPDSVDETPDETLDPATFDIASWIAGVKSTIRSVTLYQRPDLLAEADELERKIAIAGRARPPQGDGEDTLGEDDDLTQLTDRLTAVLRDFSASAMTFRVQGRTDEWRDAAEKRLKKAGVRDETELVLRQLAESIVSPAGITYEHLAHLNEVSQPQVKMLLVAWQMANSAPPRANVDVPFSRPSSRSPAPRRS